MSLIIRSVEKDDMNQLTDLMYQYIVDFYKRPKPPIENIHNLIDTLLEKKRGIQFVAEQDGKLLGFATLYFSFSTTKTDKVTVMNDLFVVENARGTGVAQELFKQCEKYTKENEYAHMGWVTGTDNYRAQRFYEKMGGSLGNWMNYSI
ncbi:GNAT family N-acetyltransferase [Metabacillus litoralis]|uniref:GNAT family N-acetyltransferase n=1 Tax=Metabacillus litoralis TaxID=152268 RepID=UPI001CFD771E|nr:GNAT family N-acetyltransferase [Metabacillus litoralis]